MKGSLQNNRVSAQLIGTESREFKKISNIIGHKKFVPEFFGESFFGDTFVIKMEFVEQSLEEALKDT